MYGPSDGQLIAFAIMIAVIGWAFIEGLLWVFRHLTWAWN